MELKRRNEIVSDSFRLMREGKTAATRLGRCDDAIRELGQILLFEQRGIRIYDKPMSSLIETVVNYRNVIVVEELQRLADTAVAKADSALTTAAKVNALTRALLKGRELASNCSDKQLRDQILIQIRDRIHETKLNGFVEAAEKAAFKGNSKRAIDQLQEALFFLRNDAVTDELQRERIEKVEARIRDLKG